MSADAAMQRVPLTAALAEEQCKFVVLRTSDGTLSARELQHTATSISDELSDAGDWLVFRDADGEDATSSSSHGCVAAVVP